MAIKRLSAPPSVKELFLAKQEEMEAALAANRRIMPHEGEKGAAAELRWCEMLDQYLPRRYSVQSGFVVDHTGDVSEQIDVIIHDAQYSPFLFRAGSSCFVPAESIYAIFDAKQEISRKTLAATGKKVASVRKLKRTSGDVWTNLGVNTGKRPERQPILGGILAISSNWKDPFGRRFAQGLNAMPELHRLDLGVAISHGAFETGTEEGDELIVYDQNTALVGFFTALIRKLQPLATALAMDLNVWSEELRNGR